MFELISKAFGRSRAQVGFRYYSRNGRPSAVQGPIFSEPVLSNLTHTLIESGLHWLFESTRTGQPTGNVDEAPPEHRFRQTVLRDSHDALLGDLTEKNVHGFKRFVALYGGSSDIHSLSSDEEMFAAVVAFSEGHPSPIKVLLIQFGDVVPDVIYFIPGLDHSADLLLRSLQVPPLESITTVNYREFKGEELETAIAYLSCAEHDH